MNIFPKRQREWLYLRADVMAMDYAEGNALIQFLDQQIGRKKYATAELADLQRYKMYRDPHRVSLEQRRVGKESFVFLLWRN